MFVRCYQDNQRFYWDGHRLHNRKWGSAKCVDYNAGDGKNLYMYQCLCPEMLRTFPDGLML